MNNGVKVLIVVCFMWVIALLLFYLGKTQSLEREYRQFKVEACDLGYAHYIINSETGDPEFEFIKKGKQ